VSLLPLLPGDLTPVQFASRQPVRGVVSIDDVYVDPYGRY